MGCLGSPVDSSLSFRGVGEFEVTVATTTSDENLGAVAMSLTVRPRLRATAMAVDLLCLGSLGKHDNCQPSSQPAPANPRQSPEFEGKPADAKKCL